MRCASLAVPALLVAAATLPSLLPNPVFAFSVIEVTSTSGEANVEGECTLRDAITAANTDTAVGGCPAGAGDDEIHLPEGAVITLSEVDNTERGASGLPAISSAIFIAGGGATIQRDPNLTCSPNEDADGDGNLLDDGEFRLFSVVGGGELVLVDLTLANGCADGQFPSDRSGGAVYVSQGSLTIEDAILRNNRAGAVGGALYRTGLPGTTTVRFSRLIDNESVDNGGAIYSAGGGTTIESSLIDGNMAGGSGGGLFLSAGRLDIMNSTISNNSTESNGGGVGTSNSFSDLLTTLTVVQSTLSGNEAGAGDDGFPFPFPGPFSARATNGFGGAISTAGSLDVRYSSLVDNLANDFEALFFGLNVLEADTRTISGSLLAGAGTLCGGSTLDRLTAEGENIATDDSCPGFTLINADPLLGPLANNGGPTPTHALLPDSPAIDAAGECPGDLATTDQRGLPRPGAGSTLCDLGAFEYQSPFIFSDRFER